MHFLKIRLKGTLEVYNNPHIYIYDIDDMIKVYLFYNSIILFTEVKNWGGIGESNIVYFSSTPRDLKTGYGVAQK
jgi:hypothetical protein